MRLLILLAAFLPALVMSDQPLVVPIKRLSMESALTIAQGTIDACRKKGIQVGVTVVDRGGHAQVVLRDVLAPALTLEISQKKAYAAVSFTSATSALTRQAGSALANIDSMIFSAGGLPVQAGGELLGAVGVSGAPGGDIDEESAHAGINAILDDLELGM